MVTRLGNEEIPFSSIRQINALPDECKCALYRSLVSTCILDTCQDGPQPPGQELSICVRCPEQSGFFEIDIRHPADPRDPLVYVQMADMANGQLQVLLITICDPFAPRFDVDRDRNGETTKFGLLSRNIPAEIEAMRAGLAPGQVRQGLRWSKRLIPVMEQFAARLGKERVFIEPLAYHNAIAFERKGFAYMTGRSIMERIHHGFQPGNILSKRMDGSTAFRRAGAERTVYGRSWAIHDGILDEPFTGIRMYKRVGHDAGECTFPDAKY